MTIWQPSMARRVAVVVHHVALDEVQVRMSVDVRELDRVAVEVVVDDDLVVLDQALDEIRPDEAGAAGDAHALARQSHVSPSSRAVAGRCPIGPAPATARAGSEHPGGAGTVCPSARRPDQRGDLAARAARGWRRSSGRTAPASCSAIGRTGMPRNSWPSSSSKIATGSRPNSLSDRYAISAASPRPQIATRRPAAAHSCSDRAQVLPHLAVKVQRVVHELVREPRLLGDAARRDQVGDAVRLHVHALDVALADQPLQVDVRQSERDAELGGEAALRDARVLLDGLEQLEVAMGFNIHDRPIHGLLSVACEGNDSGGGSGRRPGTGSRPLTHIRAPGTALNGVRRGYAFTF